MSQGSALAVQNKGTHELHLTYAPKSSYFSKQHETVAPFAKEPRIFNLPQGRLEWNRKTSWEYDRIGDLHGKAWIKVNLPALNGGNGGARYAEHIAAHFFRSITLRIGHVDYDMLTPEIIDIMDELTVPSDLATNKMSGIARDPVTHEPDEATLEDWATKPQSIYIPLNFSHTKHPGHYLPAVASYLSRLELIIETRRKDEIAFAVGNSNYNPTTDNGLQIGEVSLVQEIYLLDEPERESFANSYLSYIFLQHKQYTKSVPAGSRDLKWEIKLPHTIRAYYWVFRKQADLDDGKYGIFSGEEPDTTGHAGHAFKDFKLKLNSVDRCEPLDPLYLHQKTFQSVHSNTPDRLIYCFPNCMNAEAIDYSGGTNHSKLDSCTFEFTFSAPLSEAYQVDLITVNHNVNEFESGIFRVLFGG